MLNLCCTKSIHVHGHSPFHNPMYNVCMCINHHYAIYLNKLLYAWAFCRLAKGDLIVFQFSRLLSCTEWGWNGVGYFAILFRLTHRPWTWAISIFFVDTPFLNRTQNDHQSPAFQGRISKESLVSFEHRTLTGRPCFSISVLPFGRLVTCFIANGPKCRQMMCAAKLHIQSHLRRLCCCVSSCLKSSTQF